VEEVAVVRTFLTWVKIWSFRMRPEQAGSVRDGSRFEGWQDPDELGARYRRQGGIEASHPRAGKISRYLVQFGSIALLVLEVREVEASQAVRLELQEAGCYDGVVEVYYFGSTSAGPHGDVSF
jgi:hypothetical protein